MDPAERVKTILEKQKPGSLTNSIIQSKLANIHFLQLDIDIDGLQKENVIFSLKFNMISQYKNHRKLI